MSQVALEIRRASSARWQSSLLIYLLLMLAVPRPVGAQTPNSTITAPGNSGIITQGQSGGVNQIINQAPPPQIHVLGESTTPNANGTFTETITVEIVSDRVIPRLGIVAKKPNALEINVTGPPRSQIQSGGGGWICLL
jgi:hypothetical protein